MIIAVEYIQYSIHIPDSSTALPSISHVPADHDDLLEHPFNPHLSLPRPFQPVRTTLISKSGTSEHPLPVHVQTAPTTNG
jgi:hypothetical protein